MWFVAFLFVLWLAWRVVLQAYVWYLDWKEVSLKHISQEEHAKMVADLQATFPKEGRLSLKPQRESHLFGLAFAHTPAQIDLSAFRNVIELYDDHVHVQGNINVYQLLQFLIANGRVLKTVPDMYQLTLGGLYSGIGGGASTFRYGAFYSSVRQIEVLTSSGEVVIANEKQNADLFRLMPSTLASLGYVLSFWIDVIPCKPYVVSCTQHVRSWHEFLRAAEQKMNDPTVDFLDAVAYSREEFVLIEGRMTAENPGGVFEEPFEKPYYELAREGFAERYSRLFDFIYRWDVFGYFSTVDMPAITRNPFACTLLFHKGLMRGDRLRPIFCGKGQIKADVSDFVLPWRNATLFFERMLHEDLDFYPIYLVPISFVTPCPFIKPAQKPGDRAVDFGIAYGVNNRSNLPSREFIRKCMHMAYELGGDVLKYGNFFDKGEFWKFYDDGLKTEYFEAKRKHDPHNRLLSVDEKLES